MFDDDSKISLLDEMHRMGVSGNCFNCGNQFSTDPNAVCSPDEHGKYLCPRCSNERWDTVIYAEDHSTPTRIDPFGSFERFKEAWWRFAVDWCDHALHLLKLAQNHSFFLPEGGWKDAIEMGATEFKHKVFGAVESIISKPSDPEFPHHGSTFKEAYYGFLDQLNNHFPDPLTIYHTTLVQDTEIFVGNLQRGIYPESMGGLRGEWFLDKEMSRIHKLGRANNQPDHQEATLIAHIPLKYVDWHRSVILNLLPPLIYHTIHLNADRNPHIPLDIVAVEYRSPKVELIQFSPIFEKTELPLLTATHTHEERSLKILSFTDTPIRAQIATPKD